jgi:hypothetical protein
MIHIGKRFFIGLSAILLVLVVLVPLTMYSYLTDSFNSIVTFHKNEETELLQKIDNLSKQNVVLQKEISQLSNLTLPYLFSRLGWYLHKSDDPVSSSRNTFTIYGRIYNIGNQPANNTELTIKFYGSNETLLQTSIVKIGTIPSITNSTSPFELPFDIGKQNIGCLVADKVTNVEISLTY